MGNGQFVEAIDVWLVGRPTSLCTSAAEVASPNANGMLLYYLASAYPILQKRPWYLGPFYGLNSCSCMRWQELFRD